MIVIEQTEAFRRWLARLKDKRGKASILIRIQRLAGGHAGDVAPVGDGISEMRIHVGPGYRVYFLQRGRHVVVLLAGGDKGTQRRDIEAAKRAAMDLDP